MADQAQEGAQGTNVNVTYGAYRTTVNMAGKTVKEIRDALAKKWSIEEGAKGYLGKQEVADNTVIEAGQSLTLFRVQGEKGI